MTEQEVKKIVASALRLMARRSSALDAANEMDPPPKKTNRELASVAAGTYHTGTVMLTDIIEAALDAKDAEHD